MAAYSFETIGSADALNYNAATDSLSFDAPGSSAGRIEVAFNVDTGLIDVTSDVTGRTVVFGTGFQAETGVSFPDGSTALIGKTVVGGTIAGGAGAEAIFGGPNPEVLQGGGGDDTLVGGGNVDTLMGGAGDDLFLVHTGDAAVGDALTFHTVATLGSIEQIGDWNTGDHLSFGTLQVTASNLAVATPAAASVAAAFDAANALIGAGGADVVAVDYQGGALVFADTKQDNGTADDVVFVQGKSAASLTPGDFTSVAPATTAPAGPAEPVLPAAPSVATHTGGSVSGNMDATHIGSLTGAEIGDATATHLGLQGSLASASLNGTGFTYDANEQLTGGTISHVAINAGLAFSAELSVGSVSAAPFGGWVATDNTGAAFQALLAGSDSLSGGANTDVIHGYGGDDVIYGGGGGDQVFGGDGNDVLIAANPPGISSSADMSASNFLRGEAGDDYMVGGQGFDDINGNMGNDTLSGGKGDDWVVGGKDNDLQFGDAGGDIVWGNLGNDTLDGGDGVDQVRGGQADDVLFGGAGNDYISGDRGSDTETGGAGADVFHSFSDAGKDVVTDFNAAEGDRVMLDPDTTYTLSQVGADTVIDMGGGNEVILRDVQLSTLPSGWLFEAWVAS